MEQEWLKVELELDKLRNNVRQIDEIKTQLRENFNSKPLSVVRQDFEKRKRLLDHYQVYEKFKETFIRVRNNLNCCTKLGFKQEVVRYTDKYMKVYKVFLEIKHNNVALSSLLKELEEIERRVEPFCRDLLKRFCVSKMESLSEMLSGETPFALLDHVSDKVKFGQDQLDFFQTISDTIGTGKNFTKRAKYS